MAHFPAGRNASPLLSSRATRLCGCYQYYYYRSQTHARARGGSGSQLSVAFPHPTTVTAARLQSRLTESHKHNAHTPSGAFVWATNFVNYSDYHHGRFTRGAGVSRSPLFAAACPHEAHRPRVTWPARRKRGGGYVRRFCCAPWKNKRKHSVSIKTRVFVRDHKSRVPGARRVQINSISSR